MAQFQISTEKKNLFPKEAIKLWTSMNWGTENDYNEDKVREALNNTFFIVFARNADNELIGLARVFGDGVLHICIAEVAVHPEFQHHGLGGKIMDIINKRFGNTSIYLDAFCENEKFFEKCGFVKRSNMSVFSKRFEN